MKANIGEMIEFIEKMKKIGFEIYFTPKGDIKGKYNPKLLKNSNKGADK